MFRVFCYIIVITGCLVKGLRDVRVTIPMAARRGDSVVLHCHYDLEDDPLYSIKWYKGRAEFYRFTPKEKTPIRVFPIPSLPELDVDGTRSNQTQVLLVNVSTSMSGQYHCEVSADAPSFHTAIVAANMEVVEVPVHPPSLTGIKPRYRARDTLTANCTAAPSRPAVNLTWGITGENVNPRLVKQYRLVPQHYPDLQQSTSILKVSLRAYHFTLAGRLKVRCTASLYDLYWQTTEMSVEGKGLSVNRVPVRDDYDDYDDDAEKSDVFGATQAPNYREQPERSGTSDFNTSRYLVNLAVLVSCLSAMCLL